MTSFVTRNPIPVEVQIAPSLNRDTNFSCTLDLQEGSESTSISTTHLGLDDNPFAWSKYKFTSDSTFRWSLNSQKMGQETVVEVAGQQILEQIREEEKNRGNWTQTPRVQFSLFEGQDGVRIRSQGVVNKETCLDTLYRLQKRFGLMLGCTYALMRH